MPDRPCLDCRILTSNGSRCVECESALQRRIDRARPNAGQRGYDSAWRKVRDRFLRSHPVCSVEGCNAQATEADHIQAITDGGARLDPNNLRPFCKSHHSRHHALEGRRWNTWRRGRGGPGNPMGTHDQAGGRPYTSGKPQGGMPTLSERENRT